MVSSIKINDLSLELLTAGERFLGFGMVTFQGIPLRSAVLPWTLHFESETGITFDDFRLNDIERNTETVTLVLTAIGRAMPRIQEGDAMGDGRIRTRLIGSVEARVRWTFRPAAMTVHGAGWTGLAWTIGIESPGHPIHWLLETATWEIGGVAEGCTLIQRDMSTIWPEQPVRRDNAFTTMEKFATEGWGGSYPMDMMPRGAGASHLDFQSKDSLALALYTERPGLTRSRIDKRAGEDVIHYLDRPFFRLGEKVEAPERTLLVHRAVAPLQRHERRNLWLDVQAEVRDRILGHYGMRHEVLTPTVWAHLWDNDLRHYGAGWIKPLERILPDLAKLGFRAVFTHHPWEGPTGDPRNVDGLIPGNICSPYSFKWDESFGGIAGMKSLIEEGHRHGVSILQWFGFQLHRDSQIFKDHPEWLLREPDGEAYDASYYILNCGRMRSAFGQWLEQQILDLRRQSGLEGIFWDSLHNLGITAVDWMGPEKAPHADEIFQLMGRLQQAGFASQRPETVTIFGCGNAGLYGFDSAKFRRRLWQDTVENDDLFGLIDTAVGFFGDDGDPWRKGAISPADYFYMAAWRCPMAGGANPWQEVNKVKPVLPGGANAERYGRVNHQYNEALPHMVRPRASADGSHVLYLDGSGKPSCVWALKNGEIPWSGRAVTAVDGCEGEVVEGRLRLRAGEVYLRK